MDTHAHDAGSGAASGAPTPDEPRSFAASPAHNPAHAPDAPLYFIFIENPRGGAPRMQVLQARDDPEAQELAATALFGDLGDECGHVFKGETFAFTVYPAQGAVDRGDRAPVDWAQIRRLCG